MGQKVVFRKGIKAALPLDRPLYELLFTTDTHELFCGNELAYPVKVTDVYYYPTRLYFPETGVDCKIYIDKSTVTLYMWSDGEFKVVQDEHDHTNLSILNNIGTLLSEGSIHLTFNGNTLLYRDNLIGKLEFKADLVNGLIPIHQLPKEIKETKIVSNIFELYDITPDERFSGLLVWVLDATDDPTVEIGSAMYIFDGDSWVKLVEASVLVVDPTGAMELAIYDSNADGVVNSVRKIEGIDISSSYSYYGKDSNGIIGFHPMPQAMIWGDFLTSKSTRSAIPLGTICIYEESDYDIVPLAYEYIEEDINILPYVVEYDEYDINLIA